MRKRGTAKRSGKRPRYGILLTLLFFMLAWGGVAAGAVIRISAISARIRFPIWTGTRRMSRF
ncbi:MAG: hypothetical protein ABIJ25_13365, partial [Pseudomonadota bacterium]